MEFVIADEEGKPLGYLDEMTSIDVDVGDTNDFELVLSRSYAKRFGVKKGFRFFVPETEYGGIIEDVQSDTSFSNLTYGGYVWRGYLEQLIIQPPSGQAYLVVSGDANRILENVLSTGIGQLFTVPEEDSGIQITRYRFRYDTALEGLTKMLAAHHARLDIQAVEGAGNGTFRVMIRAVPIHNYSEELQYDGDDHINVSVRDYGCGINHLICLGQGELEERTVLHLYVQLDGSISTKQYYKGVSERMAVYDYSSVSDDSELMSGGMERLRELMNYKSAEMSISDADLQIGDIVSARDRDAGTVLSRPVVNKVLTCGDGQETVEHKLKGEE